MKNSKTEQGNLKNINKKNDEKSCKTYKLNQEHATNFTSNEESNTKTSHKTKHIYVYITLTKMSKKKSKDLSMMNIWT